MSECFAFERFVLDPANRRLRQDARTVELNGRYFDALALLLRQHGQLVSKDRFMAEVWRGVPVTDEALTQCIRTLRRQLGDDAGRPRFIETVPKHGYRFIAPVETLDPKRSAAAGDDAVQNAWREFLITGASGSAGGAVAGVLGGLIYGFAAASQPVLGASSVALVLTCATALVGTIGAAGVSFAIGTAAFGRPAGWQWTIVAGAAGGLVIGALVKMVGLDAFNLLVGHVPVEITGAVEGLLLGTATGFGVRLGPHLRSVRLAAGAAALAGSAAAIIAVLLGGRLMLGSLAALGQDLPDSRLKLDQIERLFGEAGFGPLTQYVSAALEGALFVGCVVAAILLARRRFQASS